MNFFQLYPSLKSIQKMYIRRKVFSRAIDHETGEEKLFSVNEVISEESYQRMFAKAEKEEEEKPKKGTLRKVGKGVAIGGALASLGGGAIEHVMADKAVSKMAEKKGSVKLGKGLNSSLFGGKNPGNSIRVVERTLLKNKGFKTARRADKLGTAAALAGTGAYLAGRYLDKKKKDKE